MLLAKQEEHDEDDWTMAKSAAVGLALVAATVRSAVLQVSNQGTTIVDMAQIVFPFVEANLFSADWRMRDACVMALGECNGVGGPYMLLL